MIKLAINNSPILEDYTPSVERRAAARRALGIDAQTLLIVNLARMIEHKGQAELIHLTVELKNAGYEVQTIIMGPDWGYRPALEKLIQESKLGAITKLREGSINDGKQLLAAADLCIHPSSREGLPGALTEACAAGLPIVAYDVNGVGEVVTNQNGRLIKHKDYEGLKKAVRELLDDSNLRKTCSIASLKLAKEKFSGEQMTRKYEKLFEEQAQNNIKLTEPVTTIIIPVWKRHTFLSKAIDSVFAQTSPNWRLIISVDTEQPEPELKTILDKIIDDRISVIYGPHKNQCAALNRAVSVAQTKYCSRLDSDDVLNPLAVEILAKYIKSNPRIGYFYSSLKVIDENNLPIKAQNSPDEVTAEDFRPTRLEEWFIARHWITWKIRDFAIAGGFAEDIVFGEDYLLSLTMMLHGTKFMPIKECLYNWRDHAQGSIQKDHNPEQGRAMIEQVRRRYAEMKKIMGISWEGEDPSTIRQRTPFGKIAPIQISNEQAKEYLWATSDLRRRRSFVLALIKNTSSISTKELGELFHLVLRTEDKSVVIKELTELFRKPIDYLGVTRTEELRKALTIDGWISRDQSL